jgi:hypothetical protein
MIKWFRTLTKVVKHHAGPDAPAALARPDQTMPVKYLAMHKLLAAWIVRTPDKQSRCGRRAVQIGIVQLKHQTSTIKVP